MAELNRNYGAMVTAREFWGGNNGFLTVGVQMPDANTELPAGAAYDALLAKVKGGTATEAEVIQVSNAQRNLFRIAQAIGQRAVVVAVSGGSVAVDTDTVDANAVTGANILAVAKTGATTVVASATKPLYYITFIIERADVYTAQAAKPGATYAVSVDPAAELAANIGSAGFFENKTFTQAPDGTIQSSYTADGATVTSGARTKANAAYVKVFDALPVLK